MQNLAKQLFLTNFYQTKYRNIDALITVNRYSSRFVEHIYTYLSTVY